MAASTSAPKGVASGTEIRNETSGYPGAGPVGDPRRAGRGAPPHLCRWHGRAARPAGTRLGRGRARRARARDLRRPRGHGAGCSRWTLVAGAARADGGRSARDAHRRWQATARAARRAGRRRMAGQRAVEHGMAHRAVGEPRGRSRTRDRSADPPFQDSEVMVRRTAGTARRRRMGGVLAAGRAEVLRRRPFLRPRTAQGHRRADRHHRQHLGWQPDRGLDGCTLAGCRCLCVAGAGGTAARRRHARAAADTRPSGTLDLLAGGRHRLGAA